MGHEYLRFDYRFLHCQHQKHITKSISHFFARRRTFVTLASKNLLFLVVRMGTSFYRYLHAWKRRGTECFPQYQIYSNLLVRTASHLRTTKSAPLEIQFLRNSEANIASRLYRRSSTNSYVDARLPPTATLLHHHDHDDETSFHVLANRPKA